MVNPGLTGLEEWFPLNEESGDRTGAHAEWTLTDTNTVGYAAGIKGNAADFEVSNPNEYLISTSGSNFNVGDEDFSIVFWIKPESQLSSRFLVNKYYTSGNNRQFYTSLLQANSYHPTFVVSDDGTYNAGHYGMVEWGSALSNGSWYMIVAVHDSVNNLLKISVNAGAWVTQAWSTGVYQTTSNRLQLGAYDVDSLEHDGLMDEVVLAKRAYSLDHVEWFYNSGAGRTYAELVTGPPGIKTINGVVMASTKTVNGVAVASIKSIQGIT